MKTMARKEFLRGLARGGAVAGIVALCGALRPHGGRFVCDDLCGSCPKYREGKCSLGVK